MQAKDIHAAQLFLTHYGLVRRCALAAAPVPRYAEDITQEVFVEFLTHANQWDLESDVRPLLVKTTHFVAKKYWRDHLKTLPPMLAKVAEKIRYNEAELENHTVEHPCEDEIAALWKCLDQLPAKSRSLIRSYYFDQVKTDQLAKELNIQTSSVNRTICRIRDKLRSCIQRSIGEVLQHD